MSSRPGLAQARASANFIQVSCEEVDMSAPQGPGIVLQPEEGQSYWQPRWANGYSIVKLSPKQAGPENIAMGVQVIAPGGYVREHSHDPDQEILFCFAGKGTILVDGVAHPFVPGPTRYAGPGVRHKIINDGPNELKMTWTYLPPGLDDFFAAIGRPRQPGEPAPEPFARPADVHALEARTRYGPPNGGRSPGPPPSARARRGGGGPRHAAGRTPPGFFRGTGRGPLGPRRSRADPPARASRRGPAF